MKKSTTETQETANPERKPDYSLNTVAIRGRLVAAPEVRDTRAGLVANLRLATNDTKSAEFHNISLWGKHAAECVTDLTKGQWLDVTGRLRTRTYTAADGTSRRATEIVASSVMPFEAPAA